MSHRATVPCPECGSRISGVKDCRSSGDRVYRRRECDNEHRFTTYEALDAEPPEISVGQALAVLIAHVERTGQ